MNMWELILMPFYNRSEPTGWDGDLIRASKLINLFISSKPTVWDGDRTMANTS